MNSTDLKEIDKLFEKRLDGLKTELKDDMSSLKTELKDDMSSLKTELKEYIDQAVVDIIEAVDKNKAEKTDVEKLEKRVGKIEEELQITTV